MNELDIAEVQVDFGNQVAAAVGGHFGSAEVLDPAGDDGGAFDHLLFEYAHRYVDRVWEFEAELEAHDIEDAAHEVIRELESTTRISPTVPVYVVEMLVDLAGGRRQVGTYLAEMVKELWFERLPAAQPDAQSADAAPVGGILERIEANQRRLIDLMADKV